MEGCKQYGVTTKAIIGHLETYGQINIAVKPYLSWEKVLRSLRPMNRSQGIFILIISSLIGLMFAVLVLAVGFEIQHRVQIMFGHFVASEAVKEQMRFHGVTLSYQAWDGKEYFLREGKRCGM
jgi:hypothetical protein